jgi:peroxiredoxin family protein
MMANHDVSSPEELFSLAQELGVRMVVCDMSRELSGFVTTSWWTA